MPNLFPELNMTCILQKLANLFPELNMTTILKKNIQAIHKIKHDVYFTKTAQFYKKYSLS